MPPSSMTEPRRRLGLRGRLVLALALVALAPIALLVPFARAQLDSAFSADLQARLAASRTAATAALAQEKDELASRLSALASSGSAEALARAVHDGEAPAQIAQDGAQLAQGHDLDVLTVLAIDGRTLASAQLPAKVGDLDGALLALTGDAAPRLAPVEVQGERGIEQVLALVWARPVDYGETRLWLVGGSRVGPELLARLARVGQAEVTLIHDGAVGPTAGAAEPPRATTSVELGPGTRLSLALSRASLARADARVRGAFLLVALLAALLSIGLGVLLASRITRPVLALTEGARRLARGKLETVVTTRAEGEIGELVASFNKMTADLRETTRKLVSAERIAAWQEIARGLAHELKNPLTPIQMSLETLLAAKQSRSPAFERLFPEAAQAMLEEVERLRRTIDAFSRFARLPKPARTGLELAEWAKGVLALYAEPRAGLQIDSQLAGPLPVEADRDQLTQVLVNLLKNADEAMPEGGTIRVSARREGEVAVLEVADEGPGIPAEKRAQIFEPYFTTKEKGTGLGLAISRRIVEEHGGRLELEDALPHGARFVIKLPLTLSVGVATP